LGEYRKHHLRVTLVNNFFPTQANILFRYINNKTAVTHSEDERQDSANPFPSLDKRYSKSSDNILNSLTSFSLSSSNTFHTLCISTTSNFRLSFRICKRKNITGVTFDYISMPVQILSIE